MNPFYIANYNIISLLNFTVGRILQRLRCSCSTLKQRRISTMKPPHTSTLKQCHISTLKQCHISTLKQRHISTLKQRHISTLIRYNKIECLFNVEGRRCFNVVSTCICLLGLYVQIL